MEEEDSLWRPLRREQQKEADDDDSGVSFNLRFFQKHNVNLRRIPQKSTLNQEKNKISVGCF